MLEGVTVDIDFDMVVLEVCIESVESAKRALSCGADRLELCTALSQGGLTPTVGLLRSVKNHAGSVPVMCLIRCRSGNFNYTEEDLQVMLYDIGCLKDNGADGFVIGVLNESGEIHVESCSRLRAACGSLPVTFHRAFDFSVESIPVALRKVKQIGCSRILTSGRDVNVTAAVSVNRRRRKFEGARSSISSSRYHHHAWWRHHFGKHRSYCEEYQGR
ncbi:copper homeostasis protein cutC homolog [Galendromus occidentalis]|uniref:Copper homeostasis protein cutC homolog n=1 Tax=Galendromus occidentalis TaxID=34638 RepID=A0AAJ7SH59_9ACAR|nr:copper homeostasis protein cutC homolog [Galendromus occidentalis]